MNLQVHHMCSYGISDLYMHVLCMYIQAQYRHICICTEMHILFICLYVYVLFIYVCICLSVCAYGIYLYAYMHISVHICMYMLVLYVYVCICVCDYPAARGPTDRSASVPEPRAPRSNSGLAGRCAAALAL